MSNTEKALLLLCKQIYLCTNVNVTLDHLNSLKCNNATAVTVENLWTILNILSRHAAQKENSTIDLDVHDKVTATKLYFGYLNYSDIEFFSLSENNRENSVLLLIAFSWLLVRHNVLDSLIRDKVTTQIFDHEFINRHNFPVQEQDGSKTQSTLLPLDQIDELNVVIRKSMQINYNLKDIAELINEKCRLLMKIHHEISNFSNVPHLNLSELTLIKNYYTNNQKFCEVDLQYIEKLNNAVGMINSYEKWTKKDHVFLQWMTNIMEECKSKSTIDIDNEELFKYISTIRHLNKNKIYSLETSKIMNNNMFQNLISSDSFQNHETKSCTDKWNHTISEELTKAQTELSKKVERIDSNMQMIINSLPHCIQI